MSKVIRISDETFSRLQNLAEPLVDTPASVIEKLLGEFETTLSKNKSGDQMKSYNVNSDHNLFLVPADKSNIKQSIQKKVQFNDASHYLSSSDKKKLNSILGQNNSFNCWAMTESNRSTYKKMKSGDYILLSEKGTGKFNFTGRVKGKIESESLGNKLWSFTPGKPWSLIYIIDDLKAINIDKQEMVQTLGYSSNYVVPGVIRVQRQNLNSALGSYREIKTMINSLNNN